MLNPTSHEAYAVAVQAGAGDAVLLGALPYGHTMVGPFQLRHQVPSDELYASNRFDVVRGRHLANVERWRMRALAKADIVFAWLTPGDGAAMRDLGAELGLAYGTGKAVILAAPALTTIEQCPLLTEFAWKMIIEHTALAAYERVMADLDVTFERGMARIEAKYGGRCSVCRSSYPAGETIFWSKPKGGMHVDCYERIHTPEEISNVVFNSELVRALRAENADLEKQCLDLMTKNSMLESELSPRE